MSISDIVHEIDAYLLRLEQARNLLAQSAIFGHSGTQARRPRKSGVPPQGRNARDVVMTSRKTGTKPTKTNSLLVEEVSVTHELSVQSSNLVAPDGFNSGASRPALADAQPLAVGRRKEKSRPGRSERKYVQRHESKVKLKAGSSDTVIRKGVPPGWFGVSAVEAELAREKQLTRPQSKQCDAPATASTARQTFEAIFGGVK